MGAEFLTFEIKCLGEGLAEEKVGEGCFALDTFPEVLERHCRGISFRFD